MRTCHLCAQVLGMGEPWKGGDVGRSIGGGQKVRLLKEAMDALEVQEDLVVLSVDRYDSLHSMTPFLSLVGCWLFLDKPILLLRRVFVLCTFI